MQRRTKTANVSSDQRALVVSKATLNAAERLGLTSAQLAKVLGLSEATISRMRKEGYALPYDSKEYELALFLLRLFRSVDAVLGGSDQSVRSWMLTENTALHARPIDLVTSISGLVETANYVDARRAPV